MNNQGKSRYRMGENTNRIVISTLDEERFEVKTAKIKDFIWQEIPGVLDQCHRDKVRLLIARCSTADMKTVQELERRGFLLMDTLVYYEHHLHLKIAIAPHKAITIRTALPEEAEKVRAVAAESFKGYNGHYHADNRLAAKKCDEVYSSWAFNSCISKDFANEVLVAVLENRIVGFATLRVNALDEGEGVLFGISPEAQGIGIYRLFIENSLLWAVRQGLKRMIVSTQITNIAVQKVWVRAGFWPYSSFYTFHKWFD